MRMAVVIVAAMVLPGCYSLSMYQTPEKVAAATVVEYDEYEGTTWVKAPLVWFQPWSRSHTAMLRTLITESGDRTNQLYVIYEYVDWAFLDRAADRQNNVFKTLVVSRNVDGYGISEHVAVEIPDEYIKEAAIAGIDIQLSGQRDRTVVKLPPHYVQGFIAKLNAVIGEPVAEPGALAAVSDE
jgi:hypothetical protein